MRIAITGASGFVGRRLTAALEAAGHTVTKLGREAARDLTAGPAPHVIVNLAGEPVAQRWNEETKQRIRDSRIAGTRKLVEAIGTLKTKPMALINASAVGYYGDRADEYLEETAASGNGFLAEVCRGWEEEADRAAELGIRVVKLRIGVVLGKNGGALAKMLTPFRWGLGAQLGEGTQWMSWIHLDDLIGMIQYVIDSDTAKGAWNAVAPNPVTNAEFTVQLASALDRTAWIVAPRFLVEMAAGEMSQALFFSQRCGPEAAREAGYDFRYPDLSEALRAVLI